MTANDMIHKAHKSGRPKPTTYSTTKNRAVVRKRRRSSGHANGSSSHSNADALPYVSSVPDALASHRSTSPHTPYGDMYNILREEQRQDYYISPTTSDMSTGNNIASWTLPSVRAYQTTTPTKAAISALDTTPQATPSCPYDYRHALKPESEYVTAYSGSVDRVVPTAQMVASQDQVGIFPGPYMPCPMPGYDQHY